MFNNIRNRGQLYQRFAKAGVKVGCEVGVHKGENALAIFKAIPGVKLYLVEPYADHESSIAKWGEYNKDNIVTTDCGHEFCNDCIDKWKNKCFREYKDASCPLCRQVFEYRPYDYREPIEQYQETLIDGNWRNRSINQLYFNPNNPEIINREEVNVDMSGDDPVQRRLDFGLHNTFTINNNYITNTYHNNIISISAQDIQDSLIP